jgi:hypothetical protein
VGGRMEKRRKEERRQKEERRRVGSGGEQSGKNEESGETKGKEAVSLTARSREGHYYCRLR